MPFFEDDSGNALSAKDAKERILEYLPKMKDDSELEFRSWWENSSTFLQTLEAKVDEVFTNAPDDADLINDTVQLNQLLLKSVYDGWNEESSCRRGENDAALPLELKPNLRLLLILMFRHAFPEGSVLLRLQKNFGDTPLVWFRECWKSCIGDKVQDRLKLVRSVVDMLRKPPGDDFDIFLDMDQAFSRMEDASITYPMFKRGLIEMMYRELAGYKEMQSNLKWFFMEDGEISFISALHEYKSRRDAPKSSSTASQPRPRHRPFGSSVLPSANRVATSASATKKVAVKLDPNAPCSLCKNPRDGHKQAKCRFSNRVRDMFASNPSLLAALMPPGATLTVGTQQYSSPNYSGVSALTASFVSPATWPLGRVSATVVPSMPTTITTPTRGTMTLSSDPVIHAVFPTDTGADVTMTCHAEYFQDLKPYHGLPVTLADHSTLAVGGVGTIVGYVPMSSTATTTTTMDQVFSSTIEEELGGAEGSLFIRVTIENALFVPDLDPANNLFSIKPFMDQEGALSVGGLQASLAVDGLEIPLQLNDKRDMELSLYIVPASSRDELPAALPFVTTTTTTAATANSALAAKVRNVTREELHRLALHSSKSDAMANVFSNIELDHSSPPVEDCDVCHETKSKKLPFPKVASNPARGPGERWHLDHVPMQTSLNGETVIFIVVDEFSRFVLLAFPAKTREAATYLPLLDQLIAHHGPPRTIRGDNEFMDSLGVRQLCDKHGIVRQATTPYNPQQNGMVERRQCELIKRLRSVRVDQCLPANLWALLLPGVTFLFNHLPVKKSTGDTLIPALAYRGIIDYDDPATTCHDDHDDDEDDDDDAGEEDTTKKKLPELLYPQPIGSFCWVHQRKEDRGGKLAATARPAVYLGAIEGTKGGWVLYSDLKLQRNRDIRFPKKARRGGNVFDGGSFPRKRGERHDDDDEYHRGFTDDEEISERGSDPDFLPPGATLGIMDQFQEDWLEDVRCAYSGSTTSDCSTPQQLVVDDDTIDSHPEDPATSSLSEDNNNDGEASDHRRYLPEDCSLPLSDSCIDQPNQREASPTISSSLVVREEAPRHSHDQFSYTRERDLSERSMPVSTTSRGRKTRTPQPWWKLDATNVDSLRTQVGLPWRDLTPGDVDFVPKAVRRRRHSPMPAPVPSSAEGLHVSALQASVEAGTATTVTAGLTTSARETTRKTGGKALVVHSRQALYQTDSLVENPQAEPVRFFARSTGTLSDVLKLPRPLQTPYLEALTKEYANLVENKVIRVTRQPSQERLLDSFVFFTDKMDASGRFEKVKCRFVARGDKQAWWQYGELFAQVLLPEHFRLFIAYCAIHKLEPLAVDVTAAFLQVPLEEELYLRCRKEHLPHLPQAMQQQVEDVEKQGGGRACFRICKTLYGLKQGPANFQKDLCKKLSDYGLQPLVKSSCLWKKTCPDTGAIVLLVCHFADDIGIAAQSESEKEAFVTFFQGQYKTGPVRPMTSYIGYQVDRDPQSGNIRLSQPGYVTQVLDRFGMTNAKGAPTPMASGLGDLSQYCPDPDSDEAQKMESFPFAELVGCLSYLSCTCRPDILVATRLLSKVTRRPGFRHWKCAKRVLRYLSATVDLGLLYSGGASPSVYAYTDANHVGSRDHSFSWAGYFTLLAGAPINWGMELTTDVCKSTTEAEFYALYNGTLDVRGMRELCHELGLEQETASEIGCDNQTAIRWSQRRGRLEKTKQMRIRYHGVQDAVEKGDITVVHVRTDEMPADMLTKALAPPAFTKCRDKVMHTHCGYLSRYRSRGVSGYQGC